MHEVRNWFHVYVGQDNSSGGGSGICMVRRIGEIIIYLGLAFESGEAVVIIDVNYRVINLILTKYGNLPFLLENYA